MLAPLPLPKSAFRHDINGLRAWAVLVVMLFHFGIPGFSGGFVGVDIFFVISGYLMGGIIIGGLEERGGRKFSVWNFYLSRARRILPALLVLCAILLVLGWFVLLPTYYRALGGHVLTSALFLSNIKYWLEAGYFDSASHEKWLLHTWSLSVEWQFYLLLPLLLWGVWRFWPGRRNAFIALSVCFGASLGLSIWLTAFRPEAAFFLFPTRAWEMLAGTLIAMRGGVNAYAPWQRQACEGLGFSMMAIAVFTANPETWPGGYAVLPVLGAMLVLIANRQDSPLTAPAVLQRLGDWSYSVYLWHWPVVVALAYLGWLQQWYIVLAGLVLSLLLGRESYRWVEPLGRKYLARLPTIPALATVAVATFLIALPALGVRLLQGVPGRLDPELEAIAAASEDNNPWREKSHSMGGMDFKRHIYGGQNIRAVVWGDSHASSIITAVQASLASPEDGVLGMSYTSCPTLFGARKERKNLRCAEFNEWVMQQIARLSSDIPVIISNRSSGNIYGGEYGSSEVNPSIYFDDTPHKLKKGYTPFIQEYSDRLVASACRIAKMRPVYLLRPIPEMPADVPRAMAIAAQLGRPADISMPLAVYEKRNAVVWAAQDRANKECGVNILNPLPYLCDDKACHGADGNVPRYYDDHHLGERGNKRLVPLFATVVNRNASIATKTIPAND